MKRHIILKALTLVTAVSAGSAAIAYTFYDGTTKKEESHRFVPKKLPHVQYNEQDTSGDPMDLNFVTDNTTIHEVTAKLVTHLINNWRAQKIMGIGQPDESDLARAEHKRLVERMGRYAYAILTYGQLFDNDPRKNDGTPVADKSLLNYYFKNEDGTLIMPSIEDLKDPLKELENLEKLKIIESRLLVYMTIDMFSSSFIIYNKDMMNSYFNPGIDKIFTDALHTKKMGGPLINNGNINESKEMNDRWEQFEDIHASPEFGLGKWLKNIATLTANSFGETASDYTNNLNGFLNDGTSTTKQFQIVSTGKGRVSRDKHTIDLYIPNVNLKFTTPNSSGTFQNISTPQIAHKFYNNYNEYLSIKDDPNYKMKGINEITGDIIKISLPISWDDSNKLYFINIDQLSTNNADLNNLIKKISYDGSGGIPVYTNLNSADITDSTWNKKIVDNFKIIDTIITGIDPTNHDNKKATDYKFMNEVPHSMLDNWNHVDINNIPISPNVSETISSKTFASNLVNATQNINGDDWYDLFTKVDIIGLQNFVKDNIFVDNDNPVDPVDTFGRLIMEIVKITETVPGGKAGYGNYDWDFPVDWYHATAITDSTTGENTGEIRRENFTELVLNSINEKWILEKGTNRTIKQANELVLVEIEKRIKFFDHIIRKDYFEKMLETDDNFKAAFGRKININSIKETVKYANTLNNGNISEQLAWIKEIPGVDLIKLERVITEAKKQFPKPAITDLTNRAVFNQLSYVMQHFIFDPKFKNEAFGKQASSNEDWNNRYLADNFKTDSELIYNGVMSFSSPLESDGSPVSMFFDFVNDMKFRHPIISPSNLPDMSLINNNDILDGIFGPGTIFNGILPDNLGWEELYKESPYKINPGLLLLIDNSTITGLEIMYESMYEDPWGIISYLWSTSASSIFNFEVDTNDTGGKRLYTLDSYDNVYNLPITRATTVTFIGKEELDGNYN